MGQKGLGGSSSSFADRQYKGACPYAIVDEEEALARGDDSSIPGTTINITNLASGKFVTCQSGRSGDLCPTNRRANELWIKKRMNSSVFEFRIRAIHPSLSFTSQFSYA